MTFHFLKTILLVSILSACAQPQAQEKQMPDSSSDAGAKTEPDKKYTTGDLATDIFAQNAIYKTLCVQAQTVLNQCPMKASVDPVGAKEIFSCSDDNGASDRYETSFAVGIIPENSSENEFILEANDGTFVSSSFPNSTKAPIKWINKTGNANALAPRVYELSSLRIKAKYGSEFKPTSTQKVSLYVNNKLIFESPTLGNGLMQLVDLQKKFLADKSCRLENAVVEQLKTEAYNNALVKVKNDPSLLAANPENAKHEFEMNRTLLMEKILLEDAAMGCAYDEPLEKLEIILKGTGLPEVVVAGYKDDGSGEEVNHYKEVMGQPNEFVVSLGEKIQFTHNEGGSGGSFFNPNKSFIKTDFKTLKVRDIQYLKVQRKGSQFRLNSQKISYGGFIGIGGGLYFIHTLTSIGNGKLDGATVKVNDRLLFNVSQSAPMSITEPFSSIVNQGNELSYNDDRGGVQAMAEQNKQKYIFDYSVTNFRSTKEYIEFTSRKECKNTP